MNNSVIGIYGIPNCDSVKKARQWFETNSIEVNFHDFRKEGVDASQLAHWCEVAGFDTVLNRNSTSWRKLTDQQKLGCENISGAVTIMQQLPTLIKRPIVVSEKTASDKTSDKTIIVGVNFDAYANLT